MLIVLVTQTLKSRLPVSRGNEWRLIVVLCGAMRRAHNAEEESYRRSKFCGRCGAMQPAIVGTQAAAPDPSNPTAARKQGFISICKLRAAGAHPSTMASTIDGFINANFVRRAT